MSEIFSLLDDIAELTPAPAQIVGFWRRLFGFLIDCLIVGIFGLLIGTIFFDTFAAMGGWGKLVGFIIALAYFGVMNSAVGGGQTVGKRLVNIKVVNREGELISLLRSFVRYAILGSPFFLNGATISPSIPLLTTFAGILIFGAGFAIFYLYIFNRGTRQSLHDLATGTLVVRATDVEPPPQLHLWKYHVLIAGIGATLILVSILSVSILIGQGFGLAHLVTLQENIQHSGKVHFSSVFVGKVWGASGEVRYLKVDAVWRGRPDSYEMAASEIASIVMRDYPDLSSTDALVVNVIFGFDIGIASSWQSYSSAYSPEQWMQKLQNQQ